MTVMRETGLIVVSTQRGTLHQLSLQKGRLIKKEIQCPCGQAMWPLCVQVAGREYLALSCLACRDIILMNLNKQRGNSSESQLIQYKVITAFSGEIVWRMCHGEENRLFVESSHGVVLELDTSTTTFKKVRTINPGYSNYIGLCYVPDPHRLIVVGDENEVRAMSCVEKEVIWKTKLKRGCLLYALSHDVIFLGDRSNKVWCLDPGSGLQFQEILLRDYVHVLEHMCLVNNQIIVVSRRNISYYSLK